MLDIFIMMIERLGLIVMIAFIVTRLRFFRNMMFTSKMSKKQQYMAIIYFGVFGIIGTYSGLTFSTETLNYDRWLTGVGSNEAIVNFRVIGVVLAGILGGYKVGIGAGIVAGGHRFLLGGYTALACGLASIIAGVLGAFFRKKKNMPKLTSMIVIGALAESIQMIMIVFISKPLYRAVELVQMIGPPMIIANGLGCGLFLLIIKNVRAQEERVGASQAQRTLRIADQTLAFLRKGLNVNSAKEVCGILYKETEAIAVSITDRSNILAHIGEGDDHHLAKDSIQTQATRDVIKSGDLQIASNKMIHCNQPDCALGAAVIAPLKQKGRTVGTLKFYYFDEKDMNAISMELVSGLSVLLSNQLEVAEAEEAYQLAKEAEITALQAQMSPHFMFNSLNAINSLVRIDPIKARELISSLSRFLRQNIVATHEIVTTVEKELRHTTDYLAIEETRFSNKLTITYDIDEIILEQMIPPLTLQPIVENAIKHGIKNMDENCIISIVMKKSEE